MESNFNPRPPLLLLLLHLLLITSILSCQDQREVEVYCTVDQVFSEPILKDFEKETGIRVKALYDTEETKSTGVLNRIIAEKDLPRCDIFWSGDPLRNTVLMTKGITTPINDSSIFRIPPIFRQKGHHWVGFSARARVLLYNKEKIKKEDLPHSILDMSHPAYSGNFAWANPLFGTTTFHIAALFQVLGDSAAEQWLRDLKANQVVIATSNGDVKKRVISGEVAFGMTDSDDAFEAKKESDHVDYVFLDQGTTRLGTLIIPNALSLISHGPNPENSKALLRYLLSPQTEKKLATSCAQMPLIKGTPVPKGIPSLDHIKPMTIRFDALADDLNHIQKRLKEWVENPR